MEYTTLGNTGMEISKLCLGGAAFSINKPNEWNLDEDESKAIINKALDLGINFFDTAAVYTNGESERVLGEVLTEHRDQVVIGTKVNPYNTSNPYDPTKAGPNISGSFSRKAIYQELQKSLDRLQMDTIDLYQLHFLDHITPIEETLQALDDMARQNNIHYIGASGSWTHEFVEGYFKSELLGLERFQTMQNHYNLVYREEEREKLPFCQKHGIGVIPYSPLARGYLTRPHEEAKSTTRSKNETLFEERFGNFIKNGGKEINERVEELANNKDASMAQIALAWHSQKDWVDAPIIGISKREHLEDAVEALSIKLSNSDVEYLEEPYQPREMMGPLPSLPSNWKAKHGLVRES